MRLLLTLFAAALLASDTAKPLAPVCPDLQPELQALRARLAQAQQELQIWQAPEVMKTRLAVAEADRALAASRQSKPVPDPDSSKKSKKPKAAKP